jgi:hypothetical protein
LVGVLGVGTKTVDSIAKIAHKRKGDLTFEAAKIMPKRAVGPEKQLF